MSNNIDLKSIQKELEKTLANKIQDLNNINAMKESITNDILKLQGKIEMIKEILGNEEDIQNNKEQVKQENNQENNQENSKKQDQQNQQNNNK